jgi:hypothetical protein
MNNFVTFVKSSLTKKTACAFFAVLLSVSAFAMELEGSFMLNAGANLGALQPHFAGDDDLDDSFHIGGRIQADYMVRSFLSIGLESGFSGAKIGDSDYAIGTVPILARIAWHPFSLAKADPYLVLKAGYGFSFFTSEGNDYNWKDACGGFMWGLNLGTRFFITENVGIFVEAGYECLDAAWNHPGMELEKWEESASARTFGTIGITLKSGK